MAMSLRIGVLTISDRAASGEIEDRGGPALADSVAAHGWETAARATVPDELETIADTLTAWSDLGLDAILTTGGTGLGPRDVTPEATIRVADTLVPGIAEAIRASSLVETPMAMISRGLAGVRGKTLIVNLPGSPAGATQGMETVATVLEHAVAILHGGSH
jgi:molybdenum cofactor synthesis domain-containing protein